MNDISNEVLDRYLSGRSPAAERERVEAWINAEPSRATMIDGMRSALRAGVGGSWDVRAAWRAVQERIEGDIASAAPLREGRRYVPALLRAAMLAGLLAGGWLAWREVRPAAIGPGFTAAVTAVAHRDTVALPDGSTAILAPSSRLRVAALDDTVRAFELDGEAFFSVQADVVRPFRIRSGGAVTEVLGTEFTVRSRAGDAVTVAVREGRVSLSGAQGAITLAAGQVGQVAEGGEPTLLDADPAAWLSWLDGVLEFDGDRLDTVAGELARWFGRPVTLADSTLAGRRVTGRFVTTEPEQALDALSMTLGIPWAERDDAFVLGAVGRD